MDVEHGGGQVLVAHVLLNELEADARFEQMGCVAVPQRVRRDAAIVPVELFKDRLDHVLDGRLTHRLLSGWCELVVASFGGEDPNGVTMRGPVLSQFLKSWSWKGDESILGTFTAVDVHQHAFGIDIGDLQVKSFLEPQAHAIDGGEETEHGRLFDQLQERVNFARRDDGGQFQLGFDACELEHGPVLRAGDPEEEFQGLLCDVDGAGGPLLGINDVQEVLSELIFGSKFGAVSEELSETFDGAAIRLLSPRELATKLEILLESIDDWVGSQREIGIGHRRTPWRRTTSAVTTSNTRDCVASKGSTMIGSARRSTKGYPAKPSEFASHSDPFPLPRSGLLEQRDEPKFSVASFCESMFFSSNWVIADVLRNSKD